MFKIILFDADNTLLDFDSGQYVSFRKVLDWYGIPYTREIYEEYIRLNHVFWSAFERGEIASDYVQTQRFCVLFENLGRDINALEANEKYQETLKKQSQLMPYAKEVCSKLSVSKTLAIVTNGIGATQKARMAKTGIAKYFSHIVVSEDVGFQKPDVRLFNEVFARLGNPNLNDILMVGDSLSSDMQGGINAGIHTCYFNPTNQDSKTEVQPNYRIRDLRELINIAK